MRSGRTDSIDRGAQRVLAFFTALVMVGALGLPLAPAAEASHPSGSCLDVEPETDSNPVGTQHTLTATLRTGDSGPPPSCTDSESPVNATQLVTVNFEIISGPNDPDQTDGGSPDYSCNIEIGSSSCTRSYTGTMAGTDTIRGWIAGHTADTDEPQDESAPAELLDEPDSTDVVTKTWTTGTTATRLDCDDPNGDTERETNPTGVDETYTCTATDDFGNPISGVTVQGENETATNDPDASDGNSPGTPDYECDAATDSDGMCEVTVPGEDYGADGANGGTDDVTENGLATICFFLSTTSGRTTACNDTNEPTGSSPDTGDDPFDQVEKRWQARSTANGGVDAEPETDSNSLGDDHTITAHVYDQFGAPFTGSTQVFFEFFTGSPSDDDGNDPGNPDDSCTTQNSSSCSITYTSDSAGTDRVCVWINSTPTMTGNNSNGTCDGENRNDEDDAAGEADAPEPANDDQDVVEKTWTGSGGETSASVLDCEPETDTNPTGTDHTITCSTTNGVGLPTGANVDVEFTGANDPDDADSRTMPDDTCTTSFNPATQQAQCTFTHGDEETETTDEPGTTTYRAWIDQDGSDGTSEADGTEQQDAEGEGAGTIAEPDGTDVMTKEWQTRSVQGGGVDAEPETDTNDTGENHAITATVYDQFGDPLVGNNTVNFEFFQGSPRDTGDGNSPQSPDGTCQTQNSSSCTFTYTSNAAGTDLLCVWVDTAPAMSGNNTNGTCDGEGRNDADDAGGSPDAPEPTDDNVDVVQKQWIATGPTAARRLDCTPETDSNPVNTDHTITCTATAPDAAPVVGANIDVEVTGANDPDGNSTFTNPDFTCNTGDNGQCTFTHGPSGQGTTAAAGNTTYRAWIDEDGNNGTTEADQTEGQDEAATPGTNTQESDNTDVVTKEWTGRAARNIDCEPESAVNTTGTNHTVTCTVTDRFGEPVQGASVTFSEEGPGIFTEAQEQTTDDQGTASVTVTSDQPGSQTITGTITDDLEGAEPNEVDECDRSTGDPEQSSPQGNCSDQVSKTWTEPGGRSIDCEPETATNATGTQHTVTCTVTDASGQPDQGRSVTFTETGPGEFTSPNEAVTGSNGQVQVTVTSSEEGTQSITGTLTDDLEGNEPTEEDECDRAAGDPSGAQAGNCSDTVTKTWGGDQPECNDGVDNDGDGQVDFPNDEGCGSETDNSEDSENFCPGHADDNRNQVVGTPGDDILEGTSGRDVICGLGGDDLIKGFAGADLLIGNAGDDDLRGGGGNDRLKGGSGKDSLRGGDGDDVVLGGKKNDILRGNQGEDFLDGKAGEDILRGGGDSDEIRGGKHDDTLQGGGGRDLLIGGADRDTLRGGESRDTLRGGKGDDGLRGGKGPDRMNGGPGNDTCFGGPGRDRSRNCEG